ncbi:MAG: two-component sensor histidine kinase [Vicingaceae bacterium]|jgi:two-component sensor histidine kinase
MKRIIHIFFCLTLGVVHGQQSLVDSLQHCINKHEGKDTNLVNLYTQLGNELLTNKTPEGALKLGVKAKNLAEQLKFQRGKLNAINVLGKYHLDTKDYVKAKDYFEEYIALSEELSIPEGTMQGKNNLALLYFDKGDYSASLGYHFEALSTAEKLKDYSNISMYYSNIARVYSASNQNEKAIEYTEKALKIEEEHNASPKSIIIRSINLSAYYTDFGFPDKTVNLLNRILAFNESTLKHPLYDAYMHANLGDAYLKLEKYGQALRSIKKAYPTFEENDRMRAQLDLNLASAYSFLGNSAMAMRFLKAGLLIAEKAKEPEFERFAYETASAVYKNEHNFEKSLDYIERANILKDSLLSSEQSDAIVQMQTLFETQQKEDSLTIQAIALSKERAISDQKGWLLRMSVIVLIVLALLAIVVIRLYRKARRQKENLAKKNKENELLLGEIHHRVKNNLQVISSLLSLQERSITDKAAKAAILEGKERVQSMGLIHNLLYQNNNFSGIEMHVYIEKLITGLFDTFGISEDNFDLDIAFDKINVDIDTAIPLGLIINELVVNALKYAYNDINRPMLKISLKEDNHQLVLEVEDNGPGVMEKVEKSTSFGLKLVNSLSRQLNGVIEINRKKGWCYKIAFNDYKLI